MKTLAGTWGLVRLILRRDRLLLPLWIVPLAVIPVSYVQSFGDLFPTAESRDKYASNAGFITLYGELSGTSLGEFVTWRVGFVPVMIGLFSLLTVIRHTRVEEETGRSELLGSSVVGRHAGQLRDHVAGVERYVLGIYPDGARVEIQMVSTGDLLLQ